MNDNQILVSYNRVYLKKHLKSLVLIQNIWYVNVSWLNVIYVVQVEYSIHGYQGITRCNKAIKYMYNMVHKSGDTQYFLKSYMKSV